MRPLTTPIWTVHTYWKSLEIVVASVLARIYSIDAPVHVYALRRRRLPLLLLLGSIIREYMGRGSVLCRLITWDSIRYCYHTQFTRKMHKNRLNVRARKQNFAESNRGYLVRALYTGYTIKYIWC